MVNMVNIAMCGIVLLLAFILLFKVKPMSDTKHFFDKTNSAAMRGFWCILVVVDHAPEIYNNPIKEILLSFGFVCISFYFLSSGYGLKYGISKNPDSIKYFWRNRLPKLLVPMFIANVFAFIISGIRDGEVNFRELIYFNKWVAWLLVCYFIFWVVYRFVKLDNIKKDAIICILVAVFSIVVNACRDHITVTTWCVEVYGFAWGIILSNIRESFPKFIRKRWLLSCIVLCAVSGVLGVAYLKFKPVEFFGDYLLKIVLGVAILVLFFAINTKFSFGNKLNLFLGKISYEVYLLHLLSYSVVVKILPDFNAGVCIFINVVLTVILAYLAHCISSVAIKPISKLIEKTYKKA